MAGNDYILWHDKLLIGVDEIDTQHQQLFRMINELRDSMVHGQGRTVIDQIVEFLVQYAIRHFSAEEKYMKEIEYPELLSHQKEHDYFRKKWKNIP